MGKKGSCFSAMTKALGSKKESQKSRKWFRKQKRVNLDSSSAPTTTVDPAPVPPVEQKKLIESDNEQKKSMESVNEQNKPAYSPACFCESSKSKEEIAAIKIQTAYRGYLARRALRALRGLVRLKTTIQGGYVKRQATSTLRYMQTLTRVQSQVRSRRNRMLEENQALRRQLQAKHEKEQEKLMVLQSEDNWNDSTQSREQVEANLHSKQEAAARREKALAYAYTHQKTVKLPSKATNQTFTDPNNPNWGWSWLERWMASHPWEDKNAFDKESNNVHYINVLSPTAHKQNRTSSRQSPSTPRSKTGRVRPTSTPRRSSVDDDSRSVVSAKSDRGRRRSVSSYRDDESVASSQTVPSYMAATESVKAKSRGLSPLGYEKNVTPEKRAGNSAKKRLSFSTSPSGRRSNV